MKYFTFLPFISNSTFNQAKLKRLLQLLWLDAANNMSKWYTADYDKNWIIGFLVPGNIVYDYMYVINKERKPTKKEVIEIIKALPYEYKYEMDEDDNEENRVNVILLQ